MAKHGKRVLKAWEGINREVEQELAAAVKVIKACATAKFDETVDIAMNLNLDPRKADQNLRVMVLVRPYVLRFSLRAMQPQLRLLQVRISWAPKIWPKELKLAKLISIAV
jgi:hypothetical protein